MTSRNARAQTYYIPAEWLQTDLCSPAFDLPCRYGNRHHTVRIFFCVDGVYIVMMQDKMLRYLQPAKAAQIQIQQAIFLGIAVETENGKASIVRHRIDIGHIRIFPAVI